MHALMAAVLLRMAGLDALDVDTQAKPPDRGLREAEQRIAGGKGHTVISPYCLWRPEVIESVFKNTRELPPFMSPVPKCAAAVQRDVRFSASLSQRHNRIGGRPSARFDLDPYGNTVILMIVHNLNFATYFAVTIICLHGGEPHS